MFVSEQLFLVEFNIISSVTGETILTTKIEKMSFYEKHIQNKPF